MIITVFILHYILAWLLLTANHINSAQLSSQFKAPPIRDDARGAHSRRPGPPEMQIYLIPFGRVWPGPVGRDRANGAV